MISFESDYNNGVHPIILKKLIETNEETLSGYGNDKYTKMAKEKIKKVIGKDDVDVELLTGGTQTNLVVVSTMLKDYEGVIAPKTGHISLHEGGSIEYTGHKVIELDCIKGKLEAKTIEEYVKGFYEDQNHEHMVYPGMVYLSYPTEYGTIYQKKELDAIYEICKKYQMILFIDGARLGYGLMSEEADLSIKDLASLCDVFYIGGTKVGALCGEAVVFTHNNKPKNFLTSIKRRGALLAKGRLLGIQFDTLFTDDLYFKISENGIKMASLLKDVLKKYHLEFYLESPTNQQFVIVDNKKLKLLKEEVSYSYWEACGNNKTVIRLATSWLTKESDIEKLDKVLEKVFK